MPTEMEWGRLAMALDCEGMIDIHTHRQWREHLHRVYETHYVRIIIVNTDPRLALWCRKTFGGTANAAKSRNKKWRPQLKWYASSRKAIDILRGCMPYFLLKREQAEIAFAFQETVQRIGRSGHTTETLKKRKMLAKQMKAAKRKKWPNLSQMVH